MPFSKRSRRRVVTGLVSLMTLGGGIAYALQRFKAERRGLDRVTQEQFLPAVTMLASTDVHERVAAVHTLASVADSSGGELRQRVVDILCGYLRTDRSIDEGDRGTFGGAGSFADASVESAIVSVIASHLRSDCPADTSWSECSFDLHGAVIHERCAFSGSVWNASCDFSGVTFLGAVDFTDAVFLGRPFFTNTAFVAEAVFRGASFPDWAMFSQARFVEWADFAGATFGDGADFTGATFDKQLTMAGANFGAWPLFEGAAFADNAEFRHARFGDLANFVDATFGEGTDFQFASFGDAADFSQARFGAGGVFEDASFGEACSFDETQYGDGSVLTAEQQQWLEFADDSHDG